MRRLLICFALGLILIACTPPDTPTPLPTSLPVQAPPSTPPFVIVTLPPTPVIEPTATPTPPFDIAPYIGRWQLDFRYQFAGGDPIDQMRFVGAAAVQIGANTQATGQGALTTFAFREGCFASTMNEDDIGISVVGEVGLGDDGRLELTFWIRPDNPGRMERYAVMCPDFEAPLEWEQQMLWPTLAALRVMPYTLPLESGAAIDTTVEVTGPTGGAVHGTLNTWIRLIR